MAGNDDGELRVAHGGLLIFHRDQSGGGAARDGVGAKPQAKPGAGSVCNLLTFQVVDKTSKASLSGN